MVSEAFLGSLRAEFPGWDGELPPGAEAWSKDELLLFAGSGGYLRPAPAAAAEDAVPAAPVDGPPVEDQASAEPPPPPTSTVAGDHLAQERVLERLAAGVGRWYLDVDAWQPTAEEWQFALSLVADEADRAKVMRFVFEKDRKLALGSRLLQRFCVREVLGLADHEVVIDRTPQKKPFIVWNDAASNAARSKGLPNLNFNVTHHGSVVALACEPVCVVGVDVMKEDERAGSPLEDLFNSFTEYFSDEEWRTIRGAGGVEAQRAEFYRHWSLKEAYVKAEGRGLGVDLTTISFTLRPDSGNSALRKHADLIVKGKSLDPAWTFLLEKLDPKHVVALARGAPQHCFPDFSRELPLPVLSAAQHREGLALPSPPFTQVSLFQLMAGTDRPRLLALRLPPRGSTLLGSAPRHWRERFLRWLATSPGPPCRARAAFTLSHEDGEGEPPRADLPFPESVQIPRNPNELFQWYRQSSRVPQHPSPQHQGGGWAVWTVSDLHADFKANLDWIDRVKAPVVEDGLRTAILVPGDVSHRLEVLEHVLGVFKDKFDEVFYVPGNHELWLEREATGQTSLDKFMDILELCDRLRVRCRPTLLSPSLLVVPLFSWYAPDLDDHSNPQLSRMEEGFDGSCSWPAYLFHPSCAENTSLSPLVSQLFAEVNHVVQQEVGLPSPVASLGAGGRARGAETLVPSPRIISCSHFVPDLELYPGRPDLRKVMGSQALRSQVLALKPTVHVFGHSHIPVRYLWNNIECIQVPLGYPNEMSRRLGAENLPGYIWGGAPPPKWSQ
mmetsp:Transcript_4766/g.14137  ORF Transcript_4766/g.14137 Transcript_4766/m.14137 type:complete len:782 (-) Transcript_4766:51-2396(-)